MTVLVVGGSGFLSGTIARAALAAGHTVYAVTRGRRPLDPGVRPIVADRHDAPAFAAAVSAAIAEAGGSVDLVIDAIPYTAADASQDVSVFGDRAARFVYISTDFVYAPERRRFPQPEEPAHYLDTGYGGNKRAGERVLIDVGAAALPWVILRPGHIYGPGSLLGCLPPAARDPDLISKLLAGEPIELVGAGRLLQQPVFAPDLARVILDVGGAAATAVVGRVFNVAGPEVIESVEYYRVIAECLEVGLAVKEVPLLEYARANPEKASFLCHRFYDLGALARAGIRLPDTPLGDGLRSHVESLRSA